jgi:hypothetical protein
MRTGLEDQLLTCRQFRQARGSRNGWHLLPCTYSGTYTAGTSPPHQFAKWMAHLPGAGGTYSGGL